jgi:DNA helicase MCM8
MSLYQRLWEHFYPLEKAVPPSQDSRLILSNCLYEFFVDNQVGVVFIQGIDLSFSRTHYFDVQEVKSIFPFNDLEDSLVNNPIDFANCLGLALSAIANRLQPYRDEPIIIFTHFFHLTETVSFGDIKAERVGKMVQLRGNVARVSPGLPLVKRAGFKCYKCNQLTFAYFENGCFNPPGVCGTSKCYNKVLELDRSLVTLSEFQRLRLSESESHQSAIPKILEIEVRGNLVNKCVPGDVLCIVGIVTTVQKELTKAQKWSSFRSGGGGGGNGVGGQRTRQESGLYELFIVAQSIQCLQSAQMTMFSGMLLGLDESQIQPSHIATKTSSAATVNNQVERDDETSTTATAPFPRSMTEFSHEELLFIRKLALSNQALYLMSYYLCPGIFGHELVKMGLILGLFGGSNASSLSPHETSSHSGGTMKVRSNIHILLVGDPGMGKSRLLQACIGLSPRGVFVGGATSTTAGLTAAVSRESTGYAHRSAGSDFCVEAGALVLADSGLCCIDELDKAHCDTHALLEAMEQQSISLAKGGVVMSLRCATTVFAAANPLQGKYQSKKSVSDNIHMDLALLSRFDLIFLMVDIPDIDQDRRIGEHITGHNTHNNQSIHNNNNNHNNNESLMAVDDFTSFGFDEHIDDGPKTASMFSVDGAANKNNTNHENEENLTLLQKLRRKMKRIATYNTQQCQQNQFWHGNYHSGRVGNNNNNNNNNHVNLTAPMMKRYIEYARRYVHPTLSPEAAKILQKFYLQSRSSCYQDPSSSSFSSSLLSQAETNGLIHHHFDHDIPITLRHLESLIRLAQARARIDLREIVTSEDAEEVIALWHEALDTGKLPINGTAGIAAPSKIIALVSGGNKSKKTGKISQAKQLFDALVVESQGSRMADNEGKSTACIVKEQDIERIVALLKFDKPADWYIEALREQGLLLKKGAKLFELNIK